VVCPAVSPARLYRPRRPRDSPLWQVLDRYFEAFVGVYDDRYQPRYGFWRPVIARTVEKFLACGDLQEGFARVRCPHCGYELFVAFSCRRRCLCPSCHQKRALVVAEHIARDVCQAVPHRQFVFTMPKRLRLFFRFDRRLLIGQMISGEWSEWAARRGLDRAGVASARHGGAEPRRSGGRRLAWLAHAAAGRRFPGNPSARTALDAVVAERRDQRSPSVSRPHGLGGSGILDDVRVADVGERADRRCGRGRGADRGRRGA
jgi:hypothetical protein